MASFTEMSSALVFDSVADILLDAADWPVFDIAASAISYPFRYADEEGTDLALIVPQYPDPGRRLQSWANGLFAATPPTLVASQGPERREAQSVNIKAVRSRAPQSPDEKLDRAWGSCRDFAVLFTEEKA